MQIKLNSKVMISDPCYGLNTWCQGVIEGVLPGNYNCKAKLINKTYWGERVAAIEVCHEDYKSPKYIPALLDIGVDSGQAGIFDYEYYKNITPTHPTMTMSKVNGTTKYVSLLSHQSNMAQ